MRILFVAAEISWPCAFGGEIRRWNILQGLKRAGTVDALVFRRTDAPVSMDALSGCDQVYQVDRSHLQRPASYDRLYASTLGRGALVLGRSQPLEYQFGNRTRLAAELSGKVDYSKYDVVWMSTMRIAAQIDYSTAKATILDGDDFGYVREWLILRNSSWYGAKVWNYIDVAKLRWLESRLSRRMTYVVRCSEEDRERHPAENVVVIPNGAYVPENTDREPEPRLLFVGELAYEPNRQGLEWFLDSVWPKIVAKRPDASFDIVGKNASERIQGAHGRSGIAVHGFVEDLRPLFRRAACSVVPLLAGGGTRLKILESLARAVPVVSTTLGAFGIDINEEDGIVRADSPTDLADACVRALDHDEAQLLAAHRGRERVRSSYDWNVVRQQVCDLATSCTGRDSAATGVPINEPDHTATASGS